MKLPPQRRARLLCHSYEPLEPGKHAEKTFSLLLLTSGSRNKTNLDDADPELFFTCEELPKMFVVFQRFDRYLVR